MLKWDDVRRLIVQHVAPTVQEHGFSPPGRTMFRRRGPFVDVIDFRCGKWADRTSLSFGCGLRLFVKNAPKPWNCTFDLQHFSSWPMDTLNFKETVAQQEASLRKFSPLFLVEVQRWFGLLPNIRTALIAANRNESMGPNNVGLFGVGSEAHAEVVSQLEALIDADSTEHGQH